MNTKRTPTSLCLLCNTNYATQTNSHIVPASLLKTMIGKRDKEHSFEIAPAKSSIDEYYGRAHLDNPSTEIKENHYARDYYFCPDCERKLGRLESEVTPHLTEKFTDPKFSGNYRLQKVGELTVKELPKVNPDDFNTLFLSIIWRQALQRKFDDGVLVLSNDDLELIRKIVNSYLSKDDETYQNLRDNFALMIFTAEAFYNATANLVSALPHRKKPYIFFINEFFVFAYSQNDLSNSQNKRLPYSDFQIPPHFPYLNQPNVTPKTIVLSKDFWYQLMKDFSRYVAQIFHGRLIQKVMETKTPVRNVNSNRTQLDAKKTKKKAKKKAARKARKMQRR